LLSLFFAGKNLEDNGFNPANTASAHSAGLDGFPDGKFDLVVSILHEEEGPDVLWHHFQKIAEILKPQGIIALAGGSTPVTRLADRLPSPQKLRIIERTRYRGFSLLILETLSPGK
ncbi:MAG TPA: class I SAM-dependent methyltransferase, partial [Dehalococcoidales bacterium]|nr:class I SAM-dependent methyltransferase [Dehalococcoidales bacterium]